MKLRGEKTSENQSQVLLFISQLSNVVQQGLLELKLSTAWNDNHFRFLLQSQKGPFTFKQ